MNVLRGNKTDCDHQSRSVTTYYGLERAICEDCGDLTIRSVREGNPGVLFQDWKQTKPWIPVSR